MTKFEQASDVGINGGRVAATGEGLSRLNEVLDTNGKVVPSLIVDPHTMLFKGDVLRFLLDRDRQAPPSCHDVFMPIATTTHSYVSLSGINK
jgi:hypothetical protein